MVAMHPTLLVGPADWDAARLPKEEFIGRIAAFWRACDPGIGGAVVYGGPLSHAELAYLTHATPKLEACIALIPRSGAPRLLVGGGANMVPAAKPLTWIETLLPLRDTGTTIARWRDEMNAGAVALVNGDAMPFGLRTGIEKALGTSPVDMTGLVTEAMRRKSPRELALIREACASLDAAMAAMRDAQRASKGMTDTVLAGEHAAWRRGAQDVRTLFGRDGRLGPFTVPDNAATDPLQVYVAVRHDGYWAEGFAVRSGAAVPAADAARTAFAKAVPLMRPGASYREVARLVAHGDHIGLRLDGPGCLSETSDAQFTPGEVYSVRGGQRDTGSSPIVSAMVLITDRGNEVLWRGADR
jgi:hypothetical protein